MSGLAPAIIADRFRAACRAELEALKPGNVHVHEAGHGMTVADFLASAEVSAPALAAAGRSVGERILAAVEATRSRVGQNTNLGIVLLCAPLAAAAERGGVLRPSLEDVLARLDETDAALAFRAIRIASPGGLGRSKRHDVATEPEVTLLDAMRTAAQRDRIARQYASGFADVFDVGVPRLLACRAAGWQEEWAVTDLFLTMLSAFRDSHIERKHGAETAEEVRREACSWADRLLGVAEPIGLASELLGFDRSLKARGLNPGTSADLTVASLFCAALDHDLIE
ncbi:MAG: triphosphoribosyl-dephospho-CoA synthase [Geminicoccaceae bacterium]